MTYPFSIFIITYNEADRLGATLQALEGLSADIVVVDSGSSDGTQKLAKQMGARVIEHKFEGYGPQKRFAEEQCKHDWLLNLDADEVISRELKFSIEQLFTNTIQDCDGYKISIAEVFPGEQAPHPWAYQLSPVRLYRRSKGRYVDSPVHDRVAFDAKPNLGSLEGLVHHRSVRSLGDQIAKLNGYSDRQAQDLMDKGKVPSILRLFFEFPFAFFKAYILRRHFVRGSYGLMTAMNFAFYRYLRLAKHHELFELKKDKSDD